MAAIQTSDRDPARLRVLIDGMDGRPTIAAAAALPQVAFHAFDMRPGTRRTLRGDESQTATAESTQHAIASRKASL